MDTESSQKNILLEEWKESRASIARFDEILLDLRKHGFTLITILLSADGFLYAKIKAEMWAMIGIYLALMILIYALFCIDRYHEIFLRAAVKRAEEIEDILEMRLSKEIGILTEKFTLATWGVGLYAAFSAANLILVLGSLLDQTELKCLIGKGFIILIMFVIFLIFMLMLVLYHFTTKPMVRHRSKS